MPRRAQQAVTTGIRALLIAEWDHSMRRWRVPGHVYVYEEALKSGRPVVVSAARVMKAFMHADMPGDRWGWGGVDYGKIFLLDGDELSEWHDPEDC